MPKDTHSTPQKNIAKFSHGKYRTVQRRINALRKAVTSAVSLLRESESQQEMEVALLRLELAVAKSTPTMLIDLTKDADSESDNENA